MNERQWWNGHWSRLVRRDVFVRNAAGDRWQVELRRGGAEGRRRVREFSSEEAAVGWIESAVLEDGWREVSKAVDSRRAGKVAPKLRRVS